jgi:hypothetical protein
VLDTSGDGKLGMEDLSGAIKNPGGFFDKLKGLFSRK